LDLIFWSSFNITKEEEISPQEVIDAVDTLSFERKMSIQTKAPGEGPDFFLNWASEELREAGASEDKNTRHRKFYNASVYSKAAVECLVDWFLSKFLLHLTISPMAGTKQKLEALNAEELLGISFSLFNTIVFEPRNRGIHKFELVEEQEARYGYELANLTIKNCVNTVDPSDAPVFYGELEIYQGQEARQKIAPKLSKFLEKSPQLFEVRETDPESSDIDACYLGGIGSVGSHAVLVNRENEAGKISILSSLGNGKMESRYCTIRGHFSSEQLRAVFTRLESSSPKEASEIDDFVRGHVMDALMSRRRKRD